MRAADDIVGPHVLVPGDAVSLGILEAMPGLVFIGDAQGTPVYCNQRLCDFLGIDTDAIRAGGWVDLMPPEDRDTMLRRWRDATAAGEPYEFEQRLLGVDGEYRWLLARANPIPGATGAVAGWVGVCTEIRSSTRGTEEALRESEARFAAFMVNLPAAAWIKSVGGRYLFANPEALRVFGVSAEQLVDRTDAEVFPEETAQQFVENDRAAIRRGPVRTIETLRQADGPHQSIVAKFPLLDSQGMATHIGGIAIDVTAQHAAETSLRESEARYRQLYERAEASAAAHADSERKLTLLVEATSQLITPADLHEVLPRVLKLSTQLIEADAYALWGYDDVLNVWDVLSSDGLSSEYLRNTAIDVNETTPQMGASMVVPDVDKEPLLEGRVDGYHAEGIRSILVVALRMAGVNRGTLTFYYHQPHDSTPGDVRIAEALASIAAAAIHSSQLHSAQRRINDDLTDANRRLALLSEASAVLTSGFTTDAGYGDVEHPLALTRLAQLIVPEFADVCVIDVLEAPDQIRRVEVAAAEGADVRSLAGVHLRDWKLEPDAPATVSSAVVRGDSFMVSEITPEWIAGCAPDPAQAELARSVGARSVIMAPMRARGQTIGTFSAISLAPERRYEARDLRLVEEVARRAAVALDNARLFTAAQRTAAELRTANAAKDEFLGLVSHELKTPITTILGNAEVLERRYGELEEATRSDALADIRAEADRLHRIIDNLLVLARLEQGRQIEREPMLVRRVIEHVVASHRRAFPDRIIETRWKISPTPVLGSPHYLEQTLRNLISNAEKYSPADQPIEVEAAREGAEMIVRVLDNGRGIDPDEAASLFTPFYRAKATAGMAQGVGIGLAVCKRLIEAQGGRVWARRRSEQSGSEFGFALPILEDDG